MDNIRNSMNYVQNMQASGAKAAQHGRHVGDALTVLVGAGLAHHLGNRNRKKQGLPPEPMNETVGMGMGFGLGWVFWWVPFAIYMILAVVLGLHLVALVLTVAIFVGLWVLYKKHHAKKYAIYYATKRREPVQAHAFGSDEWFTNAKKRMTH
jgi:apolipoprotein N-acyltransferase